MNSRGNIYPLVSAVVPAYNSEKWIACTLESIIAQDYPNIEIIVVNDASTDATEEAAQRKLEGCGRPFSIITHKENRGVSASRNTGMESMKGEFVWFIDSDDIAEPGLVSALYALVEEYKCDLSFCGFRKRFEDGRPDDLLYVNLSGKKIRSGEEILWLRAVEKIAPTVCGMLLRKKFLLEAGLRFHEGCTNGEDVEFQLKAFCRAGQAAFTPECLYIYVYHTGMGSVRDNDSKEKKIRRYRDNTGAQLRTAQYLSGHAPSSRIKDFADNYLMPQAVIRRFTMYARTDDRAKFDALLSDRTMRKTLSASRKYFFQRPEICLKAFALLYFPNIYYYLRRG
jgi:glycosyltransferase involved in cell wall biosynthesis